MSRWPATRVTQDAPERGTVGAPQDGKIEVPTATYPVSVYPRWPCLWRIADRVAICADDRGRFLVSMILHFTRLRVSPEMTMRRRFIPRTHAHKTDRPNMVRIRLLFPRNMSQPSTRARMRHGPSSDATPTYRIHAGSQSSSLTAFTSRALTPSASST